MIQKFEQRYLLVEAGTPEPIDTFPYTERGYRLACDAVYTLQNAPIVITGWIQVQTACPLYELHEAALEPSKVIDLRLSVFCSKFNEGLIDTKAAEIITVMADTRFLPIWDTEGKLNFRCKQSDHLITEDRESARIHGEAAMLIPARSGRMSFSISAPEPAEECSPIPEKGDEQLRRLALDLRSQGAENTHLIPKIEIARSKLTGSRRDAFERQYRKEHDAMIASGGFGPGALARTLASVREIMAA
ncbi:hypothetical protein [Agrobacterium tumefaciens]|uniref:hypothetical protein n=1 Tax=Agrobacterium tumefaciens TaxID=358 RepID=UPI001573BD1B|nr:hypothetical protein [Agrobacterium tumefaciens]